MKLVLFDDFPVGFDPRCGTRARAAGRDLELLAGIEIDPRILLPSLRIQLERRSKVKTCRITAHRMSERSDVAAY